MATHTDIYTFDISPLSNDLPAVLDGLGDSGRNPVLSAHLDGDNVIVSVSYEEDEDTALGIDLYVHWSDTPPEVGGFEYQEWKEWALMPEQGGREHLLTFGVSPDYGAVDRKLIVHLFTFEQDN